MYGKMNGLKNGERLWEYVAVYNVFLSPPITYKNINRVTKVSWLPGRYDFLGTGAIHKIA